MQSLALHPTIPPPETWMAQGWKTLTQRTFQYPSHHPLDGTGVYNMVPNPLQLKRLGWAMLRPMMPFIGYALPLDACRRLRKALKKISNLPKLQRDDLHVATHILGSSQAEQCNTQPSWIWSFGRTIEDDGTWMDSCK